MAFQGRRKDRNNTHRRPWKAIVQTFEDTLFVPRSHLPEVNLGRPRDLLASGYQSEYNNLLRMTSTSQRGANQ